MSFIIWLIVGGIIGWVASMIMRTDAQQGALMNIVVGIVGAFLGGFLGSLLFNTGLSGFSIQTILLAIVGSLILLWIYRVAVRRTP